MKLLYEEGPKSDINPQVEVDYGIPWKRDIT